MTGIALKLYCPFKQWYEQYNIVTFPHTQKVLQSIQILECLEKRFLHVLRYQENGNMRFRASFCESVSVVHVACNIRASIYNIFNWRIRKAVKRSCLHLKAMKANRFQTIWSASLWFLIFHPNKVIALMTFDAPALFSNQLELCSIETTVR